MLNRDTIDRILETEICHEPFDHLVIDDFFDQTYAELLAAEFPAYNSDVWYRYDNPIEIKRTCNSWDKFPPATYRAFWALCSREFSSVLEKRFNLTLRADYGLNGGGWHMHGQGGKLNIHQDYSIHPKIPYERKLNIIIHMSQNWKPEWGGGIELWSHNDENNKPKEMVKKYDLKFNRAVIFDTTQHSWHGLPGALTCPEDHFRKTLAIYYVQSPSETVSDRFRALFVPTKEQENDPSVMDLIEKRKSIKR